LLPAGFGRRRGYFENSPRSIIAHDIRIARAKFATSQAPIDFAAASPPTAAARTVVTMPQPPPSNPGFVPTQSLPPPRSVRTAMPSEGDFATSAKKFVFGVVDLGDSSRAVGLSTTEVMERDGLAKIPHVPVTAIRRYRIASASMPPLLSAAIWPPAYGQSAPQVFGRRTSQEHTALADLSRKSVPAHTLAPNAFDDVEAPISQNQNTHDAVSTGRSQSVLRRSGVTDPASRWAGRQGQVAMPLVVAARAASPVSVPYGRSVSTLMPDRGTSTSTGPRSETVTQMPPHNAGSSHNAVPDTDEVVERAWREVMSRLAIEQERRGFGRWS
jgi:hypothetical protein